MHKLQEVLRRARDTSARLDEIHYQLLKHLSTFSLLLLLNSFNKIWVSGDFLLIGGKQLSFLFQSLARIQQILQVRVGSTFSDSYPQEMGLPQGNILSVTLFSVKTNSISQCLKPGVDCALFVDDFHICYRSSISLKVS